MKIFTSAAILILVSLFTFSSCKKDAGFGGKNNIKGTVSNNGTALANAIVHLSVNATDETTTYDATTVTDAGGSYTFSGLQKGDYFVDAEYTTTLGIKLESSGAKVTIGSKKEDITVDLTVQ